MIRKLVLLLMTMSAFMLTACAGLMNDGNNNNQIHKLHEEIARMQHTIVDLQLTVGELSFRNEALAAELAQNSDAVIELQTESLYMRNEIMVQGGSARASDVTTDNQASEETVRTSPRIVIIEDPQTMRDSLYSYALELYRQGRHRESIEKFQEFLEKMPNDKFAVNSQYWIAENFYAMRDFNRALDEFQKVLTIYPRGSKVPDAMLKIGFTQNILGQRQRAIQTLNELIQQYPRSQPANLARQTLARWR